jgi:hypothetical protein
MTEGDLIAMETPVTPTPYEPPAVRDFGDLVALTQACFGTGREDGAAKSDDNPFIFSTPDFGDPGFC